MTQAPNLLVSWSRCLVAFQLMESCPGWQTLGTVLASQLRPVFRATTGLCPDVPSSLFYFCCFVCVVLEPTSDLFLLVWSQAGNEVFQCRRALWLLGDWAHNGFWIHMC